MPSTYIYFSEDMRVTNVYLPIYVGSVATEHLEEFPEKLRNTFRRIAEEGIDMTRMATVINRDERQVVSNMFFSRNNLTFSSVP